mmetsp:Transcript_32529/g.85442  ORF Transcript_32529/g.85442 Transcript_32529/m.85442 type:complete len:210 (+) Transcript_32529:542-1171(+)
MLWLRTRLSCCVGALPMSKKLGSFDSVRCRSNPWIPSTSSTDTVERVQRRMGAKALISRSLASIWLSSAVPGTRSHLLSSSLSANATWHADSLTTPSGFTSSRCCTMCLASTRVTMPSRRANALTSSSTRKVCATGAGSAMPVVSITIASKESSPADWRLASRLSTLIKSERTEQQMQPLSTSTISSVSAIAVFLAIKRSSMPTSPNSF